MADQALVEVRCSCGRFICAVPAGTPVRAHCRDCALTFELKAKPAA